MLVVIRVTEQGNKVVLALQSGDKESASAWRELFKGLKRRGLRGEKITLGIMDGLTGLEKVFTDEFPNAQVQSCQIHAARNVLAKVRRKLKREVADDIRSIFHASSKDAALRLFHGFQDRRQNDIPSVVKCLERTLNSCLTFFDFPGRRVDIPTSDKHH